MNRNLWLPYTQMQNHPEQLAVVSTNNCTLTLADGTKLIDGIASWWTACHGYNHPYILAAMHKQLDVMPHVMLGDITHDGALKLASRLANLLPQDLNHVFFVDSGSVSVECALKMAVQYFKNTGLDKKTKFLSFKNAYHGDTMGAMSVCDREDSMHSYMQGYLPQQFNTALPQTDNELDDFEILIKTHKDKIAALIIEPLVQGACGMKMHKKEILEKICNIARANNLLIIFDEVFTGFGRLGKMFASDYLDIAPDIICLSKALTAGTIGMGATVANEKVYNAFLSNNKQHAFMHGPTFMGNPLACAAANASLDLFENNNLLDNVKNIAMHLEASLTAVQNCKKVKAVRVKGAIGVIEFDSYDFTFMKQKANSLGVFLRPFANILYTTPALNIKPQELQQITAAMVKIAIEHDAI